MELNSASTEPLVKRCGIYHVKPFIQTLSSQSYLQTINDRENGRAFQMDNPETQATLGGRRKQNKQT